jgi:hypothetical protein
VLETTSGRRREGAGEAVVSISQEAAKGGGEGGVMTILVATSLISTSGISSHTSPSV